MNKKHILLMCILVVLVILLMPLTLTGHQEDERLTLLYIPLDNRPINYDSVLVLGEATGMRLITPPSQLLGQGAQPGQADKIIDWLDINIDSADACVISLDMMLYGGLAPSRTHYRDTQEIMSDMRRLEDIAEKAAVPIYVFGTVLRSAASSASPMQPAYFREFGDNILYLSQLSDLAEMGKATPEQLKQMESIKKSLPSELLHDYLQRREANLLALKEAVRLTSQGTLDYLVVGRDDTTPHSFTRMNMRKLESYILKCEAEVNIHSYPGADELGALMLARMVNQLNGEKPKVYVYWGTEQGPGITALYEDINLGENVYLHIISGGGEPVSSPSDADFILVVNTPLDRVTEASRQPVNSTSTTPHHLIISLKIAGWINEGKPVVVADVAYANGSDRALMKVLSEEKILPKLIGYAGCNTAGNTIGLALAQGLIYTASEFNEAQKAAPREYMLTRLIEDWGYQAMVRPEITRGYTQVLGSGTVLDDKTMLILQNEILNELNHFTRSELEEPFKQQILITDIALPWKRLFEISMTR